MRIVSITVFSLIATSMNALFIQKAFQIEKRNIPADDYDSRHRSHQLDITKFNIENQPTKMQPNTNPTPTQDLARATGLSTTPHAVNPNYESKQRWRMKMGSTNITLENLLYDLKTETDPNKRKAIEKQILAVRRKMHDRIKNRGVLLREYGVPTVTASNKKVKQTATSRVKRPWSYEKFIKDRKAASIER
ncbi:hypothetical protein BASA60_008455 [Batrachochytrium salamandrivorans]|nr:hypothetical protein BASA60_008455 [Batrachochytrium salamandrivorans]KAH6570766.1 hypothetical protein BASA62_004181 [Batrachochytrium salamandrivorans]